jgi:hypothetical protein
MLYFRQQQLTRSNYTDCPSATAAHRPKGFPFRRAADRYDAIG